MCARTGLLLLLLASCGWGSSDTVSGVSVSDVTNAQSQRLYTVAFEPPRGFFRTVNTAVLVDSAGRSYDPRTLNVGSADNEVTKVSVTFEIPADAQPETVRFPGADLDLSRSRLTRRSM
ncbi:MAG TPA: hypothetical protein VGF48_13900 [Thermoanaerobaculia bacterium]|jgi:hypothetical protein